MSNARTLADKATAGRKNYIINGNFDIWQRGIGFTAPSAGSYLADRWFISGAGGGDRAGSYGRRDFDLGQTEVPGNPKYYIRNNRLTSSLALGDSIVFGQKIEGVQTLAGEVATLSCWMRTEDSSGPKTLHVELAQNFGTGGTPSPSLTISLGTVNVTDTWQKFVFTFMVPSVTGKAIGTNGDDYLQIGFLEKYTYTNFVVALAQVQLEKGSVATDFEYRPIGEELALCQRYYESPIINILLLPRYNTTTHLTRGSDLNFKVEKRIAPTVTFTEVGGGFVDPTTVAPSTSSINFSCTATSSTANTVLSDIKADSEL